MTFTLLGFLPAIAPLLILIAFLLNDRYPGERAIESVRRFFHRLSVSSPTPVEREAAIAGPRPVRGGRLIAFSLAGRGPPFPA